MLIGGESEGRVAIDDGDEEAHSEYRSHSRSAEDKIDGKLNEMVAVSAIIGGRQRLKEFGRGNRNLIGSLPVNEGGIMVVTSRINVHCPIRDENAPSKSIQKGRPDGHP